MFYRKAENIGISFGLGPDVLEVGVLAFIKIILDIVSLSDHSGP